jgi:glycolate oxidase iron-sulfur subunit
MQHAIPVDRLGPEGQAMARAIGACVHCGFCLPTCPTYRVLGEEMDSPRGRILLMKSALEGSVPVDETLPFVDRCLGCLACVTACPSGVPYGQLLPLYRDHAERHRQRRPLERLTQALVHRTLSSPAWFRVALRAGGAARRLAGLMPERVGAVLALVPDRVPPARPLPGNVPAMGARRARVALLAGCAQQALAPAIGWATLRVLACNGVEVVVPAGQGCCGALAMHGGKLDLARDFARTNLDAFPADVDAIVTNAAGCGSAMKECPLLFAGRPEESRATTFAGRVRDVSEFLADLGPVESPGLPAPLRVAYHDACHLAHAQSVTAAPRRLLSAIPNLTMVDIEEGDLCCGSAGTYNIEQPALAATLGERKAGRVLATNAQAVVMGNIGCMVQVRMHLARLQRPLEVLHTMEMLDRAYSARSFDCSRGTRA